MGAALPDAAALQAVGDQETVTVCVAPHLRRVFHTAQVL